MKLLFDQNISSHMVALLSEEYPGSSHVQDHKLAESDDDIVWNFARHNNLVIVSKDSDFHQRSFLYGFPPKVIWLKMGNCSTTDIEKVLRRYRKEIEVFCEETEASFLILP